jgi:precorrin-2 dehydrogenase / sirohydrochlorin ferrochelatase
MPGYPIELNLTGRTALVVGLGKVGRRKTAGLLEAGAKVLAIDPAGWISDSPAPLPSVLEIRAERYRAAHLRGVALAFAAASPGVNRRVVRDARRLGVWVSSTSQPPSGDFTLPAVWRDGLLTVSVSTAGASPALAVALRDRTAEMLGPASSGLVSLLAELRPMVLKRVSSRSARHRLFTDWANPRWLDLWERLGPEAVRRELLTAIALQSG